MRLWPIDQTGEALTKADAWHTDVKGRKRRRLTTKGWYFNVQWKDGSQQWIPLKDLKESNPVEIAEYVQLHGLSDEPAFAWWVPYTLKKRDRIIASVNARAKKKTHKYGIRIPQTVAEAYEIDRQNGNDFWRKAIMKEMKNTSVAFKYLEEGKDPPPGYEYAPLHLIFDVKMDFTRKARLVFGGHRTSDPEGSTYAGVVSRESVRIAFTYAALMGLDIMSADIQNAYLSAPCSQKYYTVCGPEFGSELQGQKALIVRALYGGKSSGKDFRDHLRDCMEHLGYESCLADHDVWMRKSMKDDGTQYWEYMLLYTDDCLVVSHLPRSALDDLGKYFTLKPGSIGPPKIYLGGKVSEMELPNGSKAWAFSASQYVQEAVKNLERELELKNMKLSVKATAPISSGYRPELDVSPELDSDDAAHYQSLIGILRWIVELGRIDICCEVSMMSSHLALPRRVICNKCITSLLT
jgi:Reverse transcriptase (RNA-dependent DNA polymerase).